MTVLVQNLGDNVVNFVFKVFLSIITSLGYVGNKPCWQSVVDKTLSFQRNTSCWTARVLVLSDFGSTGDWSPTGYREPLWSWRWRRGIPCDDRWGLDNHNTVFNILRSRDILEWEQGCYPLRVDLFFSWRFISFDTINTLESTDSRTDVEEYGWNNEDDNGWWSVCIHVSRVMQCPCAHSLSLKRVYCWKTDKSY